MRFSATILASAALLNTANAALKGFNYGAFFNNDEPKKQVDFEYEFNAAKQLPGTNGWTSARLYTMIQWKTQNTVIEAIQAAINTKTTLLLGLWCSSGPESFNNEIVALKAAIQKYGTAFTDLVVGISVGSEDLYRITPTGIQNKAGPGAQPNELVKYIQQTRDAIRGTSLQKAPIGHVDTWTAYVNASNNAVISALDFIGVDAYPYFQTQMANSIGNANATFYDAYRQTVNAAKGKPVWVTETGWPVTGPQQNQAVASAANARIYWEDVSCSLIRSNVNLYYYTLQDVQWGNPSPSFGIKPGGDLMQVKPLFDLSCPSSAKPTPQESVSMSLSSSSHELSTASVLPSITLPVIGSFTTPDPTLVTDPIPSFLSTASNSLGSPMSSPVPEPSQFPFPELPIPVAPSGPKEPFVAPSLIVPIDLANPQKIIGNGFTAQISPTLSTVFGFKINSAYKEKTCHLVFYLTPQFQFENMAPYNVKANGGISVSYLDSAKSDKIIASNVGGHERIVGTALLQPGVKHDIASMPCEVEKPVAYRVDSTGGLVMDFFQMSSPALGLFMLVDG